MREGFADDASVIEGVALLTACTRESTEELLLPSPLYVAVMVVFPTVSVELLIVATPFTTGDVPRTVDPPEVKVTVPVTLVGRVSVKVTEAPYADGLAEDVSVEDGLALETVRVVDADALL